MRNRQPKLTTTVEMPQEEIALCLELGLLERSDRNTYRLTRVGRVLVDRRAPSIVEQANKAFESRFDVPRHLSWNHSWENDR